ncbi:MAG: hypothetical protein KKG04_07915, partial [Candidatus Thermoplasmatota archaeon]|nr:hypothetical protein [Candidatus Thermoplasmatota archaeon]
MNPQLKHPITFLITTLLLLPLVNIDFISTAQNIPQKYNSTIIFVGGNGPGNYSTIQEAINQATENDSIYVYDDSSPYQEHLIIPIPLTILGENTTTTHIWGNLPTDIITIQASHVHLQGFTIKQITPTSLTAGIVIYQQHNITIQNTILRDCKSYGIKLKGTNCRHIN